MGVFGKPLGSQLLAELWECNPGRIDDPAELEKMMLMAAREAGAEVIGNMFHEFEPQGVSGVVVISESHLTIHTWPELGYAAIDIFTCGEHVDPWKALEIVAQALEAEEVHTMEIGRGMKVRAKKKEQTRS